MNPPWGMKLSCKTLKKLVIGTFVLGILQCPPQRKCKWHRYLCTAVVKLTGLGKDKSSIKYGHFKDENLHFKTPTSINSSYIVLENPTFSCAGAMIRSTSFWPLKKRSIQISGKVLLYFRIMSPHKEDCKEYRTHLYLVPRKKPELKVITPCEFLPYTSPLILLTSLGTM